MKKRSLLVGAGLVVGALGAVGARAQVQRLRYGGDSAFAPFESLDAAGQPHGFQIDLLGMLGPLLGVEFDIRLRPWAQTEQAFRDGQVDVLGMVDTTERRAWALFTHGHATPALAVYRRAADPDRQGLTDLAGLRIGALSSTAMRDTRATAGSTPARAPTPG